MKFEEISEKVQEILFPEFCRNFGEFQKDEILRKILFNKAMWTDFGKIRRFSVNYEEIEEFLENFKEIIRIFRWVRKSR